MSLKVALVDDHKLFSKSLALLISTFDGIEVSFIADSGKRLFELLKTDVPDLILLDIQMPEMDGLEVCGHLRKGWPDIKVLIVTHLNHTEALYKVMEAGAHGYFAKSSEPELLQDAIRCIFEKDFYFGQELDTVIKKAVQWEKNKKAKPMVPPVHLTAREIEIIRLACQELSSTQIAYRLSINVRTVETHRKKIMEKTKSRNFIGVVLFALLHGILTAEDIRNDMM